MMLKSDMLAGHAIFTLTNTQTGKSFTYRITTADNKPHFVSVLTGPNNYEDYSFVGTIFDSVTFRHSAKSSIGKDAQSVRAFEWLWRHLGNLPDFVTVRHCEYCLRCGRRLTDEQSISSGYGPFCVTQIERTMA